MSTRLRRSSSTVNDKTVRRMSEGKERERRRISARWIQAVRYAAVPVYTSKVAIHVLHGALEQLLVGAGRAWWAAIAHVDIVKTTLRDSRPLLQPRPAACLVGRQVMLLAANGHRGCHDEKKLRSVEKEEQGTVR